jgi:hypothetical protein
VNSASALFLFAVAAPNVSGCKKKKEGFASKNFFFLFQLISFNLFVPAVRGFKGFPRAVQAGLAGEHQKGFGSRP